MSQNTKEIWRPINGFPNYTVSSKGRVKNIKSGRVLKNQINTVGYATVGLLKGNGKSKWIAIHRLVAQAFIPNPDNLAQVNHRNEIKTDNRVENLEWVTASQNMRHSAHQRSCKINQYTLDGELVKQWGSSHEIKRQLGYSNCHIIDCCKDKRKTAYGFRWQYADPSQQRKVNRPVAALTKDGEYVSEYKSVAEASRCLKISTAQIRNCLNGRLKTTHALRFIYLD